MNLQFLKPNWKKFVVFIMLFLVLPQMIENEITLFGGFYIIRSLSEVSAPRVDLFLFIIILIIDYFLSCLFVWIYDRYINKFILSQSEEEIIPEEK